MKKGQKHTKRTLKKLKNSHLGQIPWNKGQKMGFVPKRAFKDGNIPWNKGRKGVYSKESLKRFSQAKLKNPIRHWLGKKRLDMTDENHPFWRGDDVGNAALHSWVKRKLGIPSKCEHCGVQGRKWYHWSNISGKYYRKLEDWQRLCVRCHSKFDRNRI